MLELLIAILIALGCNVEKGTTADEIKAKYSTEYSKAESIIKAGDYSRTEDGGVVIVTVGGD